MSELEMIVTIENEFNGLTDKQKLVKAIEILKLVTHDRGFSSTDCVRAEKVILNIRELGARLGYDDLGI